MPAIQPPTGPIEISDPNNVPELFVNGPFNVMNVGGMVYLTLTAARPKPNDLFKASTTPEFQATIVCRLLMPSEMAEQLTRTLADSLIKASQQIRATPQTVAEPTDKLDDWPADYPETTLDIEAELLPIENAPCAGVSLAAFNVVEAAKDGVTEYWAAATLQENAVAAVEKELGPGWTVTLTDRRLTNQRLSILKMLPNTVRSCNGAAPEFEMKTPGPGERPGLNGQKAGQR